MLPDKKPFNLDLILPDETYVKALGLKKVSSLQIIDTSTKSFHDEGLYSTSIFGPVGSEERRNTFAYIDLKVPIMHPLLFKTLMDLRKMYGDIMQGRTYAFLKKTEETTDFEKGSVLNGDTGYQYLVENIDKLKLTDRGSVTREHNIKLLEKYKKKRMITKMLVIPAWYREYEVDKNGNPTDPEINTLYRKIINISNLIDENQIAENIRLLDNLRYKLQLAVYELFEYILDFLNGKKGFIYRKFARRNVFHTSRNVITTLAVEQTKLHDDRNLKANDTAMGVHQYAVNTMPVLGHHLRTGPLSKVFIENSNTARLIDPKTLKQTTVEIKPKTYETWLSRTGIEKLVSTLIQEETKHKPIMIEGYYLALLYNDKKHFRIFYDIDELPEDKDKKYVQPITLEELMYITMAKYPKKYHTFVTRYPVLGEGGIYPSTVYLVSTVPYESKTELDSFWNETDVTLPTFPIRGEKSYNSTSPNPIHLGALGGDHDGDTVGTQTVLSEEANEELEKLMKSKKYYVGFQGNPNYSASIDVAEYTLAYML